MFETTTACFVTSWKCSADELSHAENFGMQVHLSNYLEFV
jgi:hypothetical protein